MRLKTSCDATRPRRYKRAGFEASRQLSSVLRGMLAGTTTLVKTNRQIMYSNFMNSSLLARGDLHLGGSALVAEELGVHALCGDVSLALGLLDAVSVLL